MTVHDLSLFHFGGFSVAMELRPRLTVRNIQEEVAAYYGLRTSYMTSEHKAKDVSHPRQVAMFLSRELLGKSYPNLGSLFGGRDHTTVLFACRVVKKRIEEDGREAQDVRVLWDKLSHQRGEPVEFPHPTASLREMVDA